MPRRERQVHKAGHGTQCVVRVLEMWSSAPLCGRLCALKPNGSAVQWFRTNLQTLAVATEQTTPSWALQSRQPRILASLSNCRPPTPVPHGSCQRMPPPVAVGGSTKRQSRRAICGLPRSHSAHGSQGALLGSPSHGHAGKSSAGKAAGHGHTGPERAGGPPVADLLFCSGAPTTLGTGAERSDPGTDAVPPSGEHVRRRTAHRRVDVTCQIQIAT